MLLQMVIYSCIQSHTEFQMPFHLANNNKFDIKILQ